MNIDSLLRRAERLQKRVEPPEEPPIEFEAVFADEVQPGDVIYFATEWPSGALEDEDEDR